MNKRPLKWGLKEDSFKKRFPNALLAVEDSAVIVGGVTLTPMAGDCGTLILNNANRVTKETAKEIVKIASACGFNKIICTVVGYGYIIKTALDAFKFCKFKVAHRGYSNRKDDGFTLDYVLVKYIRNCEWKGYGWDRG